MAELNGFLTGIADAIRSKKGTTDKINASNFASEIESISGGGGAGAVIKTEGDWVGTTVPNSGYVENVYINTSLSVDEVNALLDSIVFTLDGAYEYIIAVEDFSTILTILNASAMTNGEYPGYMIAAVKHDATTEAENIIPIFNSSIPELTGEFGVAPFEGWYSEFNGIFEFNNTASNPEGMVGINNEALSTLFSSTPFEISSATPILLSGEYDGNAIDVKNLSYLWKVSPVPETGLIKKVYFNTNLSIEEVVEILKTLNFVPFEEGIKIWSCVTDETMANYIGIFKIDSAVEGEDALYTITVNINGETQVAFAIGTSETDGWTSDFTGVAEFNIENQIATLGPTLGLTPENEKASMLFSIDSGTPYTIDLEYYLAKQKLPLKFKINKDYIIPNEFITINENGEYDVTKYKTATINIPFTEIEIKSDISTTGVIPNTGFVSTIFLNRNLGSSEVEDLMDKVTYVTYNNVQEYYVFYKDSSTYIVFEIKSNVKRIKYRLNYGEIVMYDSSQGGWRNIADSYKYYVFNAEAVSKIDAFLSTPSYRIGIDNSKIIRLLSISPLTFRLYPTIELEGKYTGTSMIVDDRTEINILKMMEENKTIPLHIMATVNKPNGTKNITGMSKTDVAGYAFAQITDTDLVAENVPKGKIILGIQGKCTTLKRTLDLVKRADRLFAYYDGVGLTDYINYNDTDNVHTFCETFYNCSNALYFPEINTSNANIIYYMYANCSRSYDFPNINTANAIQLTGLYYNCTNVTKVPTLNTSSATDISYMYYKCKNLPKIDISYYNISNTISVDNWCYGCSSLKAIIIRSFGSTYVLSPNSFAYCYHLLGTTDATYNPNGDKDCYIYVPNNMIETLSSAETWSTYATQFRALEDYTVDGTTTGEFDDAKAGLI